MNDLNVLFSSPQFGIVLTILVYAAAKVIYDRTRILLFYPLLTASGAIIIILLATGITFETYNNGAKMLSYLLGPVTVALAIPLYRQQHHLKRYFFPIIIGALFGSAFSIIFMFYMARFFNLNNSLMISMLPKSVTIPIALDISAEFGGIPAVTVFAVMLTGLTGAIVAPIIIKIFNIRHKVAQGIGIGVASHGAGTAKALEMGELQGAMSGLAMGLAGIITAVILPILLTILK